MIMGIKEYRTTARTAITDFLKSHSDSTVTVSEIMQGLHDDMLDINISTVYRYLNRLCDEGFVNRYVSDSGEMAVYQYAAPSRDCAGHIHLQCRNCGRLIHLDCGFMDELSGHILEHHGFTIECKGSVLYGICESCGAH